MDHWVKSGDKLVRWGRVRHRVWPATVTPGFYAKSALDVHGPYDTSLAAVAACDKIEAKLKEGTADG